MKIILLSFLFIIVPITTEINNEFVIVDDEGTVIKTIERDEYIKYEFGFPMIDHVKIRHLMAELNEKVATEPENARLNKYRHIVEGKTGTRLNEQQLYDDLRRYIFEGKPLEMKVPLTTIYPKVSSELLAEISVREIGHYMTFYNEYNKERSHNIKLSTEAINNYVVFPNEHFSFNEVVGERTKVKGYLRAPVIVRGEFSEDIGGGICQVSSTLYNAVDLKGIQIVERYSHSRSVPYVPPGRDATVSWWGPDFVFKNQYSHPILIRAKAQHGQMIVHIYTAEDVRCVGE